MVLSSRQSTRNVSHYLQKSVELFKVILAFCGGGGIRMNWNDPFVNCILFLWIHRLQIAAFPDIFCFRNWKQSGMKH